MTLKDMQAVGKTLIEVLESHLPREQSNYNHIGSAVLEIFYEEFIKLVPAHVLKREKEEKSAVLNQNPSQEALQQPGQANSQKGDKGDKPKKKKAAKPKAESQTSGKDLMDLERFINRQYKTKKEIEQDGDSSSDEETQLPGVTQPPIRQQAPPVVKVKKVKVEKKVKKSDR